MKTSAWLVAALAATLLAPAAAQAASVQMQVRIQNPSGGGDADLRIHFGGDAANILWADEVTPFTGQGQAWTWDTDDIGHQTVGGGDFPFVPNDSFTWHDSTTGLFNNLYYLGSDSLWRLETNQVTASSDNGFFNIFNLGVSIYAGTDPAFNNDIFAAVYEDTVTQPIPEPASLALAAVGLGGLLVRRRRTRA